MGRNVTMSDGTQMWVPDPDPGYPLGEVGRFRLQIRRAPEPVKPEPKHRPPYLSVALRMRPRLEEAILESAAEYFRAREDLRHTEMRLALEFPEKPDKGAPEHRAWAGLRRALAYRRNTAEYAMEDLEDDMEYAERYFAVLRVRRTK